MASPYSYGVYGSYSPYASPATDTAYSTSSNTTPAAAAQPGVYSSSQPMAPPPAVTTSIYYNAHVSSPPVPNAGTHSGNPATGYNAPPAVAAQTPAVSPAAPAAANALYGGYSGYTSAPQSTAPASAASPAANPVNPYGSAVPAAEYRQPQVPAVAASEALPKTATPEPAGASRGSTRRGAAAARLAREPPRRTVQLSSAPNPARDIHYTDIPKEYATSANNPPLSTVDFIGLDDGNANPKFFRPTSGSAPATDRLVKDSHVPFGAVVSPLARPLHPAEEVPLVSGRPPVRCQRCRAYLSCHATFTDMGQRWRCPICAMSNEVSSDFFCNLDARGRRLDSAEKPELRLGSVEYDVAELPEYSLRSESDVVLPARPLYHLFLIDVSKRALISYLPDYITAIRDALHAMAELTPQCRVSFITYASQLHFYDFRDPQMPQMCVPDVENPFVPLPFATLCWMEIGTELDKVDAFLGNLPQVAQDLAESECVVGAAVRVATLVLAGQHGGRVIVSAHRHPQRGIGAIVAREQHKVYGTDKERELLRPMDGFWTSTAISAAKQQISFDLFMFPTEYCELVTLSQPSHVTNGRVFLFTNYDQQIDNTKVSALMRQVMTEEAGYAGILRVRCSAGLKVQRYRGHYLSQDVHDMDLAAITGSSTFFADIGHEGGLEKGGYVYFQTALLYTTRGGQRRVRVQSYRMPVATTLTALFGDMDLEASLFGFLQEALACAANKGPASARQSATDAIIAMLTSYRRYCTNDSSSSTLLMPSRLKLIPVYILCLLKSDALMEGTRVRVDDRVHSIFDLMAMPIHKLLNYLYPALFAAHGLVADLQCGTLNVASGKCTLPPRRQLIYDSIASHGVYLLCDEQARLVYVWIGSRVQPKAAECLFGREDASNVCRPGGPGEECFGERLLNILYALTYREDGMRRLVVVHEGERGEDAFFKQLKEEKDSGAMGHDEFLVLIHKAVNRALS